MSVSQVLSRMPWRSAGNGSGSTASWHRVSACNSVSHLEVSKHLDLSALWLKASLRAVPVD